MNKGNFTSAISKMYESASKEGKIVEIITSGRLHRNELYMFLIKYENTAGITHNDKTILLASR